MQPQSRGRRHHPPIDPPRPFGSREHAGGGEYHSEVRHVRSDECSRNLSVRCQPHHPTPLRSRFSEPAFIIPRFRAETTVIKSPPASPLFSPPPCPLLLSPHHLATQPSMLLHVSPKISGLFVVVVLLAIALPTKAIRSDDE